MLLAQVVPTVVKPHKSVTYHFFLSDQFRGFKESSGPSNVTMRSTLLVVWGGMSASFGVGKLDSSGPFSTSLSSAPVAEVDSGAILLPSPC